MVAGTYNDVIEQGSTFNRTYTLKDANGNPVDITGYRADLQIRSDYAASTTILSASTESNYLSIPTGTDGVISLSVPATVTSALDFDIGVYDLEISQVTGEVDRLVMGTMTLSKEVTRQ